MKPTSIAQFQSKKLGVSLILPQVNKASASSSFSMASSHLRGVYGLHSRDSFLVRAEASDGVEDEAVKEDEVVVEKTAKKPIVKLGDIMGVSCWIFFVIFLWVHNT